MGYALIFRRDTELLMVFRGMRDAGCGMSNENKTIYSQEQQELH